MAPATTRDVVARPPADTARQRRRGSATVVDQLLDAALVEFSAHGFEGTSTRAIARRAGAHQPQINYFFASKEALWQAAVDRLFALLDQALGPVEASDAVEAFPTAVQRFVRFSAERPALHRIMSLESTADSDRLAWIADRHTRPAYERVATGWSAVRASGAGADLDAPTVWHLIIGLGAQPSANAPAIARITGTDPLTAAEVARRTGALLALLGLHPPTGGTRP